MKYNNNWLTGEFDKNSENIKFLYFWGHQASRNDNVITKSCFSQWWVAPFEVNGEIYSTAEHWMMAGKARLFNDLETFSKIMKASTAPEVKNLGREVKGFDPEQWDKEKYNIVVNGNLAKFSHNQDLKDFLLKTGNLIIVEASPVDNVWGIGLAADHPDVGDPHKWKGENLLGYALMEVRDQLNGK